MATGTWKNRGITMNSDGNQFITAAGYVTKKHQGYGCIDKNTLFKFDVVQGVLPNPGDKVSYEAQRSTAASCWTATKVKVVQFAGNNTVAADNSTQRLQTTGNRFHHHGNNNNNHVISQVQGMTSTTYPHYNQSSQMNRFNNRRNQANNQQGYPMMSPQIPASLNSNPVGSYGNVRYNQNQPKSRFDQVPLHNYRPNISRPGRKRSPLPRKRSYSTSPSRRSSSRSRSPKRRPRYSVFLSRYNLLRVHLDTQGLKVRYPELYIPSDVAHVVRHGVDIFRDRDVLPFIKPARFHVLDSLNQSAEVPPGSSKTFRARVMLISGLTKTRLYSNIVPRDSRKDHLTKIIRFWCNNSDKEISAFGGSWNSRLDGEDPTDNQTMINTAIRTVKDQVGLDLSYCKTWYRMLEVNYHRINDKKTAEEHVEKTIVFVPTIWDCMLAQEEWDLVKHRRATEAGAPKVEIKTEMLDEPAEPMESEALETAESVQQPEAPEPAEESSEKADNEDEGTDGAIDGVTEDDKIDDIKTENIKDEKEKSQSDLNVKAMKVADLRVELDKRGLSTKGLKIQLIARLQKAIKNELTGKSADKTPQSNVNPEDSKPEIEKPDPLLEEKIRNLEIRLGIHQRTIKNLPDMSSIIFSPAKGVEPSDYSLHSLLDYDKSDKKERVFEVSLFCELYKELLQRHFAILILKALIEAEGNCEEGQSEAEASKRVRRDTENSESNEQNDEKSDTNGKDDNKYVHRPDLLCSFLYFDKNRVGYLEDDDLYTIIHSIGLNISRSQITMLVDKVLSGKTKLYYRTMCEKQTVEGEENPIQQDKVNLKEIEEVLMFGRPETSVARVDIIQSPAAATQLDNSDTEGRDTDADVVVVNGNYVPTAELPALLSKALKKVSSLESKIKNVEKENNKLSKTIAESNDVRLNFNDLQEEVKVRKKELDILSNEKTKSELQARKYKLALDTAKNALDNVITQISTCIDENEGATNSS